MTDSRPWNEAVAFFRSTAGRYLLDWELSQHDRHLANVFGYHAAQIGLPEIDYLRENRILKRQKVGLSSAATVIARPDELPLASAAMDLIVLPHQLEFSDNPHRILREAERALAPGGKLIITGFNPFSFWGAYRWFSAWREPRPSFPFNGRYIRLSRLKDWLKLLNLEPTAGAFGRYALPFSSSFKDGGVDEPHRPIDHPWMDRAGDRWWPTFGAIYVIVATKQVYGVRLLTEPWRAHAGRPSVASAPMLPTSMERNHGD